MKKFILLILFAGAILSTSCKGSKKASDTSQAQSSARPDTVVMVVKQKGTADSLLVGLDKTPCFGRCPVYKIRIFQKGFVTYEGLNFVKNMGIYSAHISPEKIAEIKHQIAILNPDTLQAKYDLKGITDLPSNKLIFNIDGKRKYVTARMNYPDLLKDFINYLHNLSDSLKYKPYQLH